MYAASRSAAGPSVWMSKLFGRTLQKRLSEPEQENKIEKSDTKSEGKASSMEQESTQVPPPASSQTAGTDDAGTEAPPEVPMPP